MLHRHKKHWLFHATMWVCAFCVLIAFGFVSWKFQNENKWLAQEVNRLTAENGNVKGELSMCAKKKMGLEKSVEGIVDEKIDQNVSCVMESKWQCQSGDCLFRSGSDVLLGMASVKGYIIKEKVPAVHTEGTFDCARLIVTDGTETLMKKIAAGTSITQPGFSKNASGQVVMSLGGYDEQYDKALFSSTEKKQVWVDMLFEYDETMMGGGICNRAGAILRVR